MLKIQSLIVLIHIVLGGYSLPQIINSSHITGLGLSNDKEYLYGDTSGGMEKGVDKLIAIKTNGIVF